MEKQKYFVLPCGIKVLPVSDITELYHLRWNEEGYKLLKFRIEVEDFSGKTSIAVKQDFYAKMYMMSLCASIAFPIDEKVKKEFKEPRINILKK